MDAAYAFDDVPKQIDGGKEKLPTPIDFAHHLSELAKRRQVSPLKGIMKYMGQPGMISMAGGLPNEAYFPFEQLSAQTSVSDTFSLGNESRSTLSWLWDLFGSSKKTDEISIPKRATGGDRDAVQLATALQYGMATGLPLLQSFISKFTVKVYQPANPLTQTLVHVGNTDGWSKAVATLCNAGEGVLVEEFTYPSAIASAHPLQVTPVPIKMDGEGMCADDLEKVLGSWDPAAHGGMKRPHVMYTVPVGQNPSGTTMEAQRKKEVYAVCVKYDVIIVEDDPYYFLQVGKYVPKAKRGGARSAALDNSKDGEEEFIGGLAPSYLKFDTEGRVIRLDTFSKTIAPGSRLGWFTCNPLFAERLQRMGESSTQAPCGFGQALITQLIAEQWGMSGWIRWLRGIRAQYTMRRDLMLDLLDECFDLREEPTTSSSGAQTVLVARKKGVQMTEKWKEDNTLFSLVPPTAGMFAWLKVHMYNHPMYPGLVAGGMSPGKAAAQLTLRLWIKLAQNNVLFSPGWFFGTDGVQPDPEEEELYGSVPAKMEGYFRISYSNVEPAEMKKGMEIFARELVKFFA